MPINELLGHSIDSVATNFSFHPFISCLFYSIQPDFDLTTPNYNLNYIDVINLLIEMAILDLSGAKLHAVSVLRIFFADWEQQELPPGVVGGRLLGPGGELLR